MQAQRDRDHRAVRVIPANGDARTVASLATQLLAGWMSGRDLDELRAAVLLEA